MLVGSLPSNREIIQTLAFCDVTSQIQKFSGALIHSNCLEVILKPKYLIKLSQRLFLTPINGGFPILITRVTLDDPLQGNLVYIKLNTLHKYLLNCASADITDVTHNKTFGDKLNKLLKRLEN